MAPYGDGTGPRGMGSGTGRGSGQCGGGREKKVNRWRGLLNFFQGSYKEEPSQRRTSSGAYPLAVVDKSKCTGCGVCVDNCAFTAIALEGALACVQAATCVGCGACMRVCPREAISLTER